MRLFCDIAEKWQPDCRNAYHISKQLHKTILTNTSYIYTDFSLRKITIHSFSGPSERSKLRWMIHNNTKQDTPRVGFWERELFQNDSNRQPFTIIDGKGENWEQLFDRTHVGQITQRCPHRINWRCDPYNFVCGLVLLFVSTADERLFISETDRSDTMPLFYVCTSSWREIGSTNLRMLWVTLQI